MTTPSRSFLAMAEEQAAAQPELFSVDAMVGTVEAAMAARGDFTAAGFFRHHPKAYLMTCALLASGLYGLKEVADMAGVSVNTIRAVEANEPEKIDTLRKDLADRARRTARKLVISIEKDVDEGVEMSVRDKAVALGILTQYSELLSGNATERIDVTNLDASKAFAAFQAQLDALPPMINVTPDASATGLGGESLAPKGEPVGLGMMPPIEAPMQAIEAELIPTQKGED